MTIRSSDLSPQQRAAAGLPVAATKKLKPSYSGYLFDSKLERDYAMYLDLQLKQSVSFEAWWYSPIKLRIDDRCWYSPDFLLMYDDALDCHHKRYEIHETKGFCRDDARVKMKAVMPILRQLEWPLIIVRREGGRWTSERWE